MKTFEVIVCDPPWRFGDPLKMDKKIKRGAAANYPTMSDSEILALNVNALANPDHCVLALWVPGSMLEMGLQVIKTWGFNYKQIYIWVKTKKDALKETDLNKITSVGMGRTFRQSHEVCLIGARGKPSKILKNKAQRSVSFHKNERHSKKPELLQNSLELMYPEANKLEMFARRVRPLWTCLGNEIDGKDIVEAINDLLEEEKEI